MYGLHSGTEVVASRVPKIGVERMKGLSDGPHPGLHDSGRIRAAWGKGGLPARGERPTWRSRHGSIAVSVGGPKQTNVAFSGTCAESYHAGVGGSDWPRQPAGRRSISNNLH